MIRISRLPHEERRRKPRPPRRRPASPRVIRAIVNLAAALTMGMALWAYCVLMIVLLAPK